MRPKVRLLGVAGAFAMVAGVLLAPPASAADASPPALSVRNIDATKQAAVKVTFLYTGDPTKLNNLTLRENGSVQRLSSMLEASKAGTHLATLFVVDESGSMNDDATLTNVKRGIDDYVRSMPAGDQAAIVSYNDAPVVESGFTDDQTQLTEAVKGMDAPRDGHTATWDALKKAVTMFSAHPDLQPNLVLITDGKDDRSEASQSEATAAVVSSGAGMFTLKLGHSGGFDSSGIDAMVARTGGVATDVPASSGIGAAFKSLDTTLHDQYVITYQSSADQGAVDVSLAIDGVTREASFVAGSTASGAATVSSVAAPKALGPGFLHTQAGGLAALALVGLAVGLAAFAVASLASSSDDSLQAVLRPYSEGPIVGEDDHDGALAQTAILQRAVELTEEFAERQGFLVKVEAALERADLPLRAAEALFFWGAGGAIVTLGAFALGGVVLGGFFALISVLVPPAVVNFLASRRAKKFQSSLPDTLSLLSGSLRAGYSLLQGVEAVSKEVADPMGQELRRMMTEARLGREIEDAMEQVADRMGSPDFAWAVMAVRIQREVGGNLSELLLTVAETMVQRERLRRDVAALTAEGKMSAIILGLLPIGLGAFMWLGNPTYMHPLGATTIGHVLLGVATAAGLAGFAWMKKIININI